MVPSPDGDTGFFNIVVGILQLDTLASYKLIICPDYELRTMNVNRSNKNVVSN